MKTDIVFADLKEGSEVYSLSYGRGKVKSIGAGLYPINVSFNCGRSLQSYMEDGRRSIDENYPLLFLTNPFEKNQERVIEVSPDGTHWYKRVLIKITDSIAICWHLAETIEESKNAYMTESYNPFHWRELQPEQPTAQPKEITLDGVEYVLTPKVK